MKDLIVVMGVSGCGKSTVGSRLAARLGVEFLEGDRLHSARSIALMASGTALTDEDRRDWLERIAGRLAHSHAQGRGLVVSCSALKRAYRDILRGAAAQLRFVYLRGDFALLERRTARRRGHYMPASLLRSQFATLEPPDVDENALTYDVSQPPLEIVHALYTVLVGSP